MKIDVCNDNVNECIEFNEQNPDYIIDFDKIFKDDNYLDFSGIYFIVNTIT